MKRALILFSVVCVAVNSLASLRSVDEQVWSGLERCISVQPPLQAVSLAASLPVALVSKIIRQTGGATRGKSSSRKKSSNTSPAPFDPVHFEDRLRNDAVSLFSSAVGMMSSGADVSCAAVASCTGAADSHSVPRADIFCLMLLAYLIILRRSGLPQAAASLSCFMMEPDLIPQAGFFAGGTCHEF